MPLPFHAPSRMLKLESHTLPRYSGLHCTSRRLYPGPARVLTKADERILRRLQTNTFLSSPDARHFIPEISGTCPTCQVLADTFHVVASRPATPLPFSPPFSIPTREAWRSTCSAALPWMHNAPWWRAPGQRPSPMASRTRDCHSGTQQLSCEFLE